MYDWMKTDPPEVPEQYITESNDLFNHYLFYENHKREKECWCSGCNEHFTVPFLKRTQTSADDEFSHKKHNDIGKCPKCGRDVVIKSIGRGRKNLTEWQRAAYLIVRGNSVTVRCFFLCKSYTDSLTPEIYVDECKRYYMMPGVAVMWKYAFTNFKNNHWDYDWEQTKSVYQPFVSSDMYYNYGDYAVFGLESLKNSFLKYSQLELWAESQGQSFHRDHIWPVHPIEYLCRYALYPSLEYMLKLGFVKLVEELIYQKRTNGRALNWKASNPPELFKATKQEFKEIAGTNPDGFTLYWYRKLKKAKLIANLKELTEFKRQITAQTETYLNYLVKYHAKPGKLLRYLEKAGQGSVYSRSILWKDYVQAAQKLHYDLPNEVVLFPKKLKQAHDTAISAVVYEENRESERKMAEVTRRNRKKYEYESGNYKIAVPASMGEIIAEGKILSHCVGGYAERHAQGKLVILFLRKVKNPDKPFFTIEMNGDRLVQIHGDHNKGPEPEIRAFVDAWLAWLKQPKEQKNQNTDKGVA